MGDGFMRPEVNLGHVEAASHPLAQLLACPPITENLLNAAAKCIDFQSGETIFHQGSRCKGLYIILSGQLLRKTNRLEKRLTLGTVGPGEIVELAAALGEGYHTYTLTALDSGSMLLLPVDSLHQAFDKHPPLRMQLLAELAREVSRAYATCGSVRLAGGARDVESHVNKS
jgi:CRP-like cAMP-binding protein